MIHTIQQDRTEKIICHGDSIIFCNRPEWSDATWRPLKLSLIRERQFFDYDPHETLPVIIWITGGAFTHSDANVWAPELAWFAKRGFAVASIDYSSAARMRFPMPMEDIKWGIRYLKAHAQELHLDPDRMVVMGESAGAYFAALTALTSGTDEFKFGEYKEFDSDVKAAITLYTCAKEVHMEGDRIVMPDLTGYIRKGSLLPFLMFHGTEDGIVSCEESRYLHDALTANGGKAELYLVEGAHHADCPFYQEKVKEMIIEFINSVL